MYLVTYEFLNIASEWLPGARIEKTLDRAMTLVSETDRNVEFFERVGDAWLKIDRMPGA